MSQIAYNVCNVQLLPLEEWGGRGGAIRYFVMWRLGDGGSQGRKGKVAEGFWRHVATAAVG